MIYLVRHVWVRAVFEQRNDNVGRFPRMELRVAVAVLRVWVHTSFEQSEDLLEWVPVEGELTRTIPVPDGKKFFRFAMDRGERADQG